MYALTAQSWPVYHADYIVADTLNITIQVDGVLLGVVPMPAADAVDKNAIEAFVAATTLYKVGLLLFFVILAACALNANRMVPAGKSRCKRCHQACSCV